MNNTDLSGQVEVDLEAEIDAVDALLPQTQCTRCGYKGCRPYAEAIVTALAPINQCPPGGAATIASLAERLSRAVLDLNPAHGEERPLSLAKIDPQVCIGCTLCIQVCPVDAIVGAAKKMHAVILAECTGCELCIPVCPVDCITMEADSLLSQRLAQPSQLRFKRSLLGSESAQTARHRWQARNARLSFRQGEKAQELQARRLELEVAKATASSSLGVPDAKFSEPSQATSVPLQAKKTAAEILAAAVAKAKLGKRDVR